MRRGSKQTKNEGDDAAAALSFRAAALEAAAAFNIDTDDEQSNPDTPQTTTAPSLPISAFEEYDDVVQQQQRQPAAPSFDTTSSALDTRFVSVNQACQEIWKCQEAQQAADWLELLHHALLKTPLNAYLPSEVFVCISGAALRFHKQEQQPSDDSDNDDDVLWKVWEEAMWAAAALARVCVGAAWRLQLKQRRQWTRLEKRRSIRTNNAKVPSILPVDGGVSSTNHSNNESRSSSPMTLSPLDPVSDKSYPAIPENLPSAMLRFAAMDTPSSLEKANFAGTQKWADRHKSLAEAQRELVLALCYLVPEEEPDDDHPDLEWTILEAHEPVACMVRSWLLESSFAATQWRSRDKSDGDNEALMDRKPQAKSSDVIQSKDDGATSGDSRAHLCELVLNGALDSAWIDWWTTLQVVRATFQLVSAGWRVPQNQVGEEIIVCVLAIAERGMLLRASDLKSYDVESGRVTREERLAASSSAMTAISILSAVASVGLVPINMQLPTAKVMCRAQIRATDACPTDLFPIMRDSDAVREQEEWKADYDTFLEQREDSISDILALYWVLLAHSSSAAEVMSVFSETMNLVEAVVGDETVVDRMNCRIEKVQSACIAVDAVSGALWGKPPDMPGIEHLRIYWYDFLRALRGIAFRVHKWIVELDENWIDNPIHVSSMLHHALLLLLQVISSLKHFVDEELLRGNGLLAPDEWDVIIDTLDENIDKWLSITENISALSTETVLIREIRSGLSINLLDSLRDFFNQNARFESSPFNVVVEDECRVKLYSVMLRKAVPYLPPEKGTLLALAVLRCWSATGFAIHMSDKWGRTASYMITDVFSVFDDQSFGFFQGFVHSPSVRLEALRLIALGEETEQYRMNAEEFASSEQLSPLEASLHLREQYLALVNGSLLPPLLTMFGAQSSNIHVAVVLPRPVASFSSKREPLNNDFYGDPVELDGMKQTIEAEENELRRFAVHLLGRLYRSGTGEKFHRLSLLKMMLSAAIDCTSMEEFRLPAKTAGATGFVDAELLFNGESHNTALQAIQELRKCLILPFGPLPNAHSTLPPVVDALCSVLIVYGGEPVKERDQCDESLLALKRCLAITAVLPLARLGISHDKRLVLDKHRDFLGLVPTQMIRLLVDATDLGATTLRREHQEARLELDVSPFLVVSDHSQPGDQTSRPTSERTQFSFVSVLSSILATLHINLECKRARDKAATEQFCGGTDAQPVEILDSNFRALCYDALGGFVRSGVHFPFTKELVPIIIQQIQVVDVSTVEAAATCRCAASVVESLAATGMATEEPAGSYHDDADYLIRYLLSFCSSSEPSKVLIGCQSLRGIVGFISQNDVRYCCVVVKTLSDRMKVQVERLLGTAAESARSGVEELDATESLLSLLSDIICASDESERNFPPSEMILRTLDTCLVMSIYLCSLPGAAICRTISVRLVGVLLNKLSTVDSDKEVVCSELERSQSRFSSLVVQKASEREDGQQTEAWRDDEDRFCMVLTDMIAQQRVREEDTSSIPTEPLPLTYHELLAKETDEINRFVVEKADAEREAPFAAWLCGKSTVLTFRLGSHESRYRGWLEIVMRSSTKRARRMLRLPSINSLESPELPSSLWDDPASSNDEFVPREVIKKFAEPSSEMKRALSAMKKFDETFDQPHADLRPSSTQPATAGVEASGSIWKTTSCHSSVGNEIVEEAESIDQWLHLVLEDTEAVQCAEDELRSLGLTRLLRSPATTGSEDGTFLPVERLHFSSNFQRALSIIDRIPPFNTHKIAVLLATDALANATSSTDKKSLEEMLLLSTAGSPEFLRFTQGMGKLVLSRHLKYYSGGLDTSGFDSDGKFCVIWLDRNDSFARSMIVFHVVPLMPEGSNNRKRHVGNDNVHIVFIEPGCAIDQRLCRGELKGDTVSSLVSGHFGFVTIFVQTVAGESVMKVSVRLREGLADSIRSRLEHLVGEHITYEASTPDFVRRLAARADVACCVILEDKLGKPNWEERQDQLTEMQRHRI